MGGQSFDTHLAGAWFFGMPGGLFGSFGTDQALPPVVSLALVFAYPLIRLVTLSLQRTSGGKTLFIGLANYRSLFRDDVFIQAVRNNLTLLLCVPIMVVMAVTPRWCA